MSKNPTDTNQASEDDQAELRETLLDKLAIIKYEWLFDVDKLKVDLWTEDLQALIQDEILKARIDEARNVQKWYGGQDEAMTSVTGYLMPLERRIEQLKEQLNQPNTNKEKL